MYACNRKTNEMIFGIDRKTINQHLQVFDRYSKAMVYIYKCLLKTSYLHKNVGNTNVSNCQIILSFPMLLYWNKIKKTVWYSDKEVENNRFTFFNNFLIRCFEICQQANGGWNTYLLNAGMWNDDIAYLKKPKYK